MDVINTAIATTKTISNIFSGLLVPLIAIITVYIAYQQYKTNKNRLRFELYDKRYEIYLSVKSFISGIVSRGNVIFQDASQFAQETREAEFLFNDDISNYIEEIYKKAIEIHAIHASYESLPPGDRRASLVKKEFELLEWFNNQIEITSMKFSKYLNLRNIS